MDRIRDSLVVGFHNLRLFKGREWFVPEVFVARQVFVQGTLGLDGLMVQISLCDGLAMVRNNGGYYGNFVERSPSSHGTVGKAIFQKADYFVCDLTTPNQ